MPQPERAPRLRRIATLIDDQAPRSHCPAEARALACRMRRRASELEAGAELSDAEEATRLQAEMAGE